MCSDAHDMFFGCRTRVGMLYVTCRDAPGVLQGHSARRDSPHYMPVGLLCRTRVVLLACCRTYVGMPLVADTCVGDVLCVTCVSSYFLGVPRLQHPHVRMLLVHDMALTHACGVVGTPRHTLHMCNDAAGMCVAS